MSHLAAAQGDNRLVIPVLGLDDHAEEYRPITRVASSPNFHSKMFDTAGAWGKAAEDADGDTVLIADNRIDRLNSLAPVGLPEVKTAQGNMAGIRLLSDFCSRRNIVPGLKLLYTNYQLDRATQRIIEARKAAGDYILVVYKFDQEHIKSIEDILSEFYRGRLKVFIRDKFAFVTAVMDEWRLLPEERAPFFGVSEYSKRAFDSILNGPAWRDIEVRCDLIYRLRANLDLLFGESDLDTQAKWLHANLSILDDKTPIDFLEEGYQDRLAELVFRVEEP